MNFSKKTLFCLQLIISIEKHLIVKQTFFKGILKTLFRKLTILCHFILQRLPNLALALCKPPIPLNAFTDNFKKI